MVVTEIALLRLKSGIDVYSEDLRAKLSEARMVMQNYTKRNFYYFLQIEDPALVYIIGEWDSLDQHVNHFINSDANQELLENLKDDIVVEWLLHVDTTHANLPLPRDTKGKNVISIVRHFVKDGEKNSFADTYEANKEYLQAFVTEGVVNGGWRADRDGEQEEWVLLCPWKDVEQHHAFAQTDGFEKYSRIREHISGAEINHAELLDI